jgi:hypothetical protein
VEEAQILSINLHWSSARSIAIMMPIMTNRIRDLSIRAFARWQTGEFAK